MDHFGIGAAMSSMAATYYHASRRTGRTTSLVESVKDGDRIVFVQKQEADRVKRLCEERGVTVECIVIDPATPERLFKRGTSAGRTILDHSWVELFYERAIQCAADSLRQLQAQTSGYGHTHRETKRQAEELARWRMR